MLAERFVFLSPLEKPYHSLLEGGIVWRLIYSLLKALAQLLFDSHWAAGVTLPFTVIVARTKTHSASVK